MPKRHRLLAANWKMNPPPEGFDAKESPFRPSPDIDVVVFPTTLDIARCIEAGLTTGGQAARSDATGAYTGDVSMTMLARCGAQAVLCGHSERREHHGETDEHIAAQVKAAIDAGLLPILCIGETAEERDLGAAEEVVRSQLTIALKDVSAPIVIAYEPVWAIGTGNVASTDDIQTMHAAIRSWLPDSLAGSSPIIYGGSVKPENATDIFACNDVDGALVGGASLKADTFATLADLLRASPL